MSKDAPAFPRPQWPRRKTDRQADEGTQQPTEPANGEES